MEINEPMHYRQADTAGGSYFFTVNLGRTGNPIYWCGILKIVDYIHFNQ